MENYKYFTLIKRFLFLIFRQPVYSSHEKDFKLGFFIQKNGLNGCINTKNIRHKKLFNNTKILIKIYFPLKFLINVNNLNLKMKAYYQGCKQLVNNNF